MELSEVRSRFDEVLVKHIQRLLELETLAASLSFNLSSISCLLLLVERENEIRNFPTSPPQRYTRESFLDDLSNIGLEIDDELMGSFQALAQYGYVMIHDDDRYHAQISAFALVSFLDNLFPGMTGLNLVGFIIQMMNEVLSNRKELKDALEQFDQTLLSQGIPLSRQKLKQDEKETLQKQVDKTHKTFESKTISEDLKLAYVERLSKLRNREDHGVVTPKVYQRTRPTPNVAVQDLFAKPSAKPIDGRTSFEEESEKPEERTSPDREKMTAQKMVLEAEIKAAELATREAEIKAAEIAAREAEIRAREAEIRARESEMRAREAEKELVDKTAEVPSHETRQSGIEKKIEAFQNSMAMDCPLCHTGKIRMEESETGRKYFSCSNQHCGFISWGKPYGFPCPLCKNPFLVEFVSGERAGLKCPRATCSFSQDHLGQPAQPRPGDEKTPKRRKLVRVRKK